MSKRLLILNYHDIHTGDEQPRNRYSVHIDAFRDHMDLLRSKKVVVSDLNAILDSDNLNGLHVAITFDDGFLSQFELAVPILIQNHFVATFFIVSDYKGPRFMQCEHISRLSELGFEIGSHGVTHKSFTRLTAEELLTEVVESTRELTHITGQPTRFLSLPFSRYNARVVSGLRSTGLKAIFTTDTRINVLGSDDFVIHRMNLKSSTNILRIDAMLEMERVTRLRYYTKNLILRALRKFSVGILNARDEDQHKQFISS
jgi:peptidoglycan/xylan/chitin deacetylase (PgdA/CDA1 family)